MSSHGCLRIDWALTRCVLALAACLLMAHASHATNLRDAVTRNKFSSRARLGDTHSETCLRYLTANAMFPKTAFNKDVRITPIPCEIDELNPKFDFGAHDVIQTTPVKVSRLDFILDEAAQYGSVSPVCSAAESKIDPLLDLPLPEVHQKSKVNPRMVYVSPVRVKKISFATVSHGLCCDAMASDKHVHGTTRSQLRCWKAKADVEVSDAYQRAQSCLCFRHASSHSVIWYGYDAAEQQGLFQKPILEAMWRVVR